MGLWMCLIEVYTNFGSVDSSPIFKGQGNREVRGGVY